MNFSLTHCYYFLLRPSAKLLDVVAIDHLPSLLPKDNSDKYAAKLLPFLLKVARLDFLGLIPPQFEH